MTIDTHTLHRLTGALQDALEASLRFQPLLKAEQDALTEADLTALMDILDRKKHLTEHLLLASQTLLNWCAEQGIEPDYQAFEHWTTNLADSDRGPLLDHWQQLRQSLDANHRSNAVNRQLLASLTTRNQAQLALLKNLVGSTDTYSASGTRNTGMASGWVDSV